MSFEIFFHAIKHDLRTPFQAAVAGIHFTLNQLHFSCLQVNKSFSDLFFENYNTRNTLSHMLPIQWTSMDRRICMLYHHSVNDLHFVLQMFDFDKYAMAHLMRIDGDSLSDMDIVYDKYFGEDLSSFEDSFRYPEKLFADVKETLLRPVLIHKRNLKYEPECLKISFIWKR